MSEPPVDVTASADPVAALLDAHARGAFVRLPTSGTSGTPRLVVRSTASWVASFGHVTELLGLSARSRVWVPGPLTATMNLFSATHAAYAGAEQVPTPGSATHATLTPAALARLPDLPAGLHVLVAGDRLDEAAYDAATAAGLQVSHYYGAAELSFVAWGRHADALEPFPEVDVVERDGELWVRSPYLCEGYDGPPGPMRTDPAGYATVGDRGVARDGRVRVHGRDAEAVTTAGATVLVGDVEGVLAPAARGALVVCGVTHEDLGAVLAAVLTDATDHGPLTRLSRERLDPAARPRVWFHADRLPLTGADKLDRTAVAAMVAAGDGVRRL